jgi:hypothetical protein
MSAALTASGAVAYRIRVTRRDRLNANFDRVRSSIAILGLYVPLDSSTPSLSGEARVMRSGAHFVHQKHLRVVALFDHRDV